tara:strand:- start:10055 stop:10537 length:483 start_codon:yes stop_codon:yes gene_type:complete
MKYRVLSNKELESLKDDFIRFLSANTVTGKDWAKIKSNKPNEASKLIEIFSDIVWEKSLEKIKYLEHRDDKYLKVFFCGENKMEMVGFKVNAKNAPSLLDENIIKLLGSGEFKFSELSAVFSSSEKNYKISRNMDMFSMIESGCVPCEKVFFYGIKSLLK